MEERRSKIVSRVIEKGGIYAEAARKCGSDPFLQNKFIQDCFSLCHHQMIWRYWGIELVLEIVSYRVRSLRLLYEECMLAQRSLVTH